MKLNLDESMSKGVAITYTHENRGDGPAYIDKILGIPGLSSVFRVADFMAIQRKPTAGWEEILSQARLVLEDASLNRTKLEAAGTSAFLFVWPQVLCGDQRAPVCFSLGRCSRSIRYR